MRNNYASRNNASANIETLHARKGGWAKQAETPPDMVLHMHAMHTMQMRRTTAVGRGQAHVRSCKASICSEQSPFQINKCTSNKIPNCTDCASRPFYKRIHRRACEGSLSRLATCLLLGQLVLTRRWPRAPLTRPLSSASTPYMRTAAWGSSRPSWSWNLKWCEALRPQSKAQDSLRTT